MTDADCGPVRRRSGRRIPALPGNTEEYTGKERL